MSQNKSIYKRKIAARLLAAVMAILLLTAALPAMNITAEANSDGMIRVKLTRLGASASSVAMTTVGGYTVNGAVIASGSTVKVACSGSMLTLTADGKQLASGSRITMSRTSGGTGTGVRFTSPSLSNLFCGDLTFSVSGSSVQTVLSIYIETYLYGVVPYEMSNSFPIDALKAQTIAARTYAMRAKRSGGSYDVTDNTSSQVFKGYNSSYSNAIKAVDGTRGIVLMSGDAYAQCYYTASNGGQTESTKNAWGSGGVSYLTVKDDPYDRENPNSIVKSYSIPKNPEKKALNTQLRQALISAAANQLEEKGLSAKESDVSIDEIVNIEPHTPKYDTPSRTYTKLRFAMRLTSVSESTGNEVSTQVEVDLNTYSELQSMLNLSINSADNEIVSVEEDEDAFKLSFARYGHGIGLSQRGAQWMAKQHGMSYEEILAFYYPGTDQIRLSLKEVISGGAIQPEPAPTRAPVESEDGYETLQEGDSGEAVKRLQERLGELGYFTGTPLGNYKSLTIAAVKAYQEAMGLKADGIATPELQKMIFAEPKPTVTPAPTPTPEEQPAEGATRATVKLSSSSSKLNVRKSASTSSEVVGTLRNGAKATVLAVSGDWRKIQSGSLTGYVLAAYLSFETADEDGQPESGYQTLRYGDSSEAVRALQEQLKELGFFDGQTLGNYRSLTEKAVKAYQTAMGLEADGIATPALQEMIFAGKLPESTKKPEETPAPEQEEEGIEATVSLGSASSKLNVRKAASTSSAIVGTLRHGEQVRVLFSEGEWSRIRRGSMTGYVKTDYLITGGVSLPTETPRPNPTPKPEQGAEGVATITLRSASSKLNVRKSATTNSSIVGTLNHGTQVEVLENSDGWSRIRSGSMTGYVMTSYLTWGVAAQPGVEPTGAPSAGKSEYEELSYGDSGEAVKRLQARLKELGYFNGQLGGNFLQLTREAVEAYQQANGWTVNGIASPELQKEVFEETSAISANATVRVGSGSYLNLRKSASSGSDVTAKMQNGARVCVTGSDGDWYCVQTAAGQSGYAKKEYIQLDD